MNQARPGGNGRADTPAARTAFDDGSGVSRFHEWVLNLPWVVERPAGFGTLAVRIFAVECEPLDRRQAWLLTGARPRSLLGESGVAVILPVETAEAVERAGWARRAALMPARHVLVTARRPAGRDRRDVEALVLLAHGCAMS